MIGSKSRDYALSGQARTAMNNHDYDKAIIYLRRIAQRETAIKLEHLVIQHQQNYLRKQNTKQLEKWGKENVSS